MPRHDSSPADPGWTTDSRANYGSARHMTLASPTALSQVGDVAWRPMSLTTPLRPAVEGSLLPAITTRTWILVSQDSSGLRRAFTLQPLRRYGLRRR